MSLLSSPPSLSSNSILCLAVDGRKQGKGMLDLLLNCGWIPTNDSSRTKGYLLSTFPSLAGLNHLLDAEGNEVAQQDEQEDSWLAVLEPLQIGLAWSYISYHFLSWASLFLGIRTARPATINRGNENRAGVTVLQLRPVDSYLMVLVRLLVRPGHYSC
jgi:hypothetical protein